MLLRWPWNYGHLHSMWHCHTRSLYLISTLSARTCNRKLATKSTYKTKIFKPSSNSSNANLISSSTLSYHWDTHPPTQRELTKATQFFNKRPPTLLFSESRFFRLPISVVPEVAFLGRSNVGKSSLLNAVLGAQICHTSRNPGRTKTMNFFAVGGEDGSGNRGKITVLDMPGYGKGSREEWGREVEKYLAGRRGLRRAFLLVNAHHGLLASDIQILSLFRQRGIPHQVLLHKVDRILLPDSKAPTPAKLEKYTEELKTIMENVKKEIQPGRGDGPEALGEILACSAEKRLGIDAVRCAVLRATGFGHVGKKLPLEGDLALDQEEILQDEQLALSREGSSEINSL